MTEKAPEATRGKILNAAFLEFYQNGFQAGSLNQIVERAGITKGALFHHFKSKKDLGYAVMEEVIGPLGRMRWIEPLNEPKNALEAMKSAFRKHIKQDSESDSLLKGCPLNNMAQEMSPLDEGFRRRVEGLYDEWRAAIAAALERGIKAGVVRKEIHPRQAAALIVAGQMGIWGTGKNSQSKKLMVEAGEALCAYLDGLKAQ